MGLCEAGDDLCNGCVTMIAVIGLCSAIGYLIWWLIDAINEENDRDGDWN
jgi:hypothetical protein